MKTNIFSWGKSPKHDKRAHSSKAVVKPTQEVVLKAYENPKGCGSLGFGP